MVRPTSLPPRYDLRMQDLRRGHHLVVTCMCGHRGVVSAERVKAGRRPHEKLIDIERKFRCQRCGMRGDLTIAIGTDPR